jgi:hypothetical protein
LDGEVPARNPDSSEEAAHESSLNVAGNIKGEERRSTP